MAIDAPTALRAVTKALVFAAVLLYLSAVPVAAQRAPADSLRHSAPGLPPYAAAAMATETGWYPGMPTFLVPFTRARYNRIEALSLAAIAGWQLGENEYTSALLRLGGADLVVNGELEFAREKGFRRQSAAVFHRLVSANDWGNPLALGASLGALIIGRDEGLYYRVGGAELRLVDSVRASPQLALRLFAERHRTAMVKNDFSIGDAFGDRNFRGNIVAREGDIAGASAIFTIRRGVEATEFRFFAELKLEGAAGDFDYSRGMFEATAAAPVVSFMLGSLTVSSGTSGGALPAQRAFYLGGTRSLRGQRPGALSGNAFWMTQAELGTPNVFARPVIFFDAGWAGSRDNYTAPGRIATGAGVGGSFFDGSLRLDIARGLFPGRGWRGALYLEGRF